MAAFNDPAILQRRLFPNLSSPSRNLGNGCASVNAAVTGVGIECPQPSRAALPGQAHVFPRIARTVSAARFAARRTELSSLELSRGAPAVVVKCSDAEGSGVSFV